MAMTNCSDTGYPVCHHRNQLFGIQNSASPGLSFETEQTFDNRYSAMFLWKPDPQQMRCGTEIILLLFNGIMTALFLLEMYLLQRPYFE
jgi:hypothetical protein